MKLLGRGWSGPSNLPADMNLWVDASREKRSCGNKDTDTQSFEELWNASLENMIFGKTAPLDPEVLQKFRQEQGGNEGSRSDRMHIYSDSGSGAQSAKQEPRAETVADGDTSAAHTVPCPDGPESQQSASPGDSFQSSAPSAGTSKFADAVKPN